MWCHAEYCSFDQFHATQHGGSENTNKHQIGYRNTLLHGPSCPALSRKFFSNSPSPSSLSGPSLLFRQAFPEELKCTQERPALTNQNIPESSCLLSKVCQNLLLLLHHLLQQLCVGLLITKLTSMIVSTQILKTPGRSRRRWSWRARPRPAAATARDRPACCGVLPPRLPLTPLQVLLKQSRENGLW